MLTVNKRQSHRYI